ncbi:MAG: sugar phosphate nucleotidyltransferase [Sphaerochaetaceae bacterium]|nr:sugar phosphate nucleotidyltransferase [Spirochaetales bacterium]MDY5498803.1 sugar phosphate nucleotidyltransferase [Sphaerochaetaceae bacterium]
MIALVLAAGYATRLYPLTKGFPKPLLEVQGKPVLSWLLDDLETIPGIEEYVIASNHVFLPFFQKWSREHPLQRKVTILDDGSTENENRLGAVKDILFSIGSLGLDDDLLVLAGDNLLEFSLGRFVDYFHQKKASCILRFEERNLERLRRTGVAEVDSDGRVLSMEEKPQNPKSTWAVPPFYCFTRNDVGHLPESLGQGCKTDAPGSLISWACGRFPIWAMKMPAARFDIGNLESYEQVQKCYRGILC